MLIKEIQELINSINHNTSKEKCYSTSGATIEGIKEAITLNIIDKLIIENDLFYCNEEEVSRFFEKLRGQVFNELLYRYNFSIKNKKILFKKLVKECIIKELNYYQQDRKQIFFNLGKLIELMTLNDFKIKEKDFIKLKNSIYEYESRKDYRSHDFKTVQGFKKWLVNYLPCNINNISVKKQDNKYIVECNYYISIPYVPLRIKKLDIELKRIDTELHNGDRIYKITNYKEKKLNRVNNEISRLNKLLEKKVNVTT